MLTAVGQRLVLQGLTKKGNDRIKEMNTVWRVVGIADTVLFSTEQGPWLLVEPLMEDQSKRLRGSRWIHGVRDKDFVIVKEV